MFIFMVSLFAFQAICDRTRNCLDPEISWVIDGLIDGFRMGYIGVGQFVIAKIEGLQTLLRGGPHDEVESERPDAQHLAAIVGHHS